MPTNAASPEGATTNQATVRPAFHVAVPHGKTTRAPSGTAWRRWLTVGLLVLLPIAVYWPAVFHRYGFRDDYSILREAHEEPGKVTRVCAMQARPVYGFLLETAFRATRDIDDFAWIRFGTAGLVGLNVALLFLVLCWLGWNSVTAALFSGVVAVLPSVQVAVSWAVAMPLCVASLLSLVGFVCAERAFRSSKPSRKGCWWMAALALVFASALTYQPNSLFYLALVAAAMFRRPWCGTRTLEWFVRHGVTAFIGVSAAFTVMMVGFAAGWVPVSHRVGLEHDWFGKAVWFVQAPLHNAFGLVAINDNKGSIATTLGAIVVGAVIAGALVRSCRTFGPKTGLWWSAGIAALMFGSFAVNFVVADRWPVYRVILPLTTTVLAVFVFGVGSLFGERRIGRAALCALVAAGAWLAHRQAFELIAVPQSIELQTLEAGARNIRPERRPRVFVITPKPEDRVHQRLFSDEFGSLSTDSDWASKEMLKVIMWSRFPEMRDVTQRYTFACGRSLPKGKAFDLVIDLRRLREKARTAGVGKAW